MFWQITLIVLFFIVTAGVGFYCRKRARSTDDFVLGGRNIGAWLSAFAYGTSYFSATVFIGYAGQYGWQYGVSALWIGLGNAFIGSYLAWSILGRRTRVMTKHLNASTMPEFFDARYGSKALKMVSSVIIFVFLIPYSASVYKGLSRLFSMAFNIEFTYVVVGMALLTAIYVIAGGYMAAAINDFIEGIVMLVGIALIVAAVLNGRGGFSAALAELSTFKSEVAPSLNGAFVSIFGPEPLNLLAVCILTSLGACGLPQMVHKFYAIKGEKAVRKGTFISTVFALIVAGGSYFMGAFGRLYYKPGEDGVVHFDHIVPDMLLRENVLSDTVIGIVLLVVLSASISTLSSVVITSSSTFVSDFVKFFKKSRMIIDSEVMLIRIMCAAFIAISVAIALIPNSLITTLMSLSWGALSGAFLGPLVYGLFWKRTTRASVWCSIVFGVGFVSVNAIFSFTNPAIAAAISIVASLVIVPLVSLVTRKPSDDTINGIFSCYDETVTAKKKNILSDNGNA